MLHGLLSRASLLVFVAALSVVSAGGVESSETPQAPASGRIGSVHPGDGSVPAPDSAAEAVTAYRRTLAVSPDDARTHYDLALALRGLGDLRGAGEHFTRSLALEPRCETYADFGLLQDRLGREDLARESYEKGIALDSTCSAARMNFASMLIEDGKYEEAGVHYRKAIEAKPSAEAHSGLGFALNQLGRLDEAAKEHEAAVALDPGLAEVHRNRALTQARLGAYEEAIVSYRRAIAIEPRVSTYYSLAGVLRSAGRKDEAEAEYRRGRELSGRAKE